MFWQDPVEDPECDRDSGALQANRIAVIPKRLPDHFGQGWEGSPLGEAWCRSSRLSKPDLGHLTGDFYFGFEVGALRNAWSVVQQYRDTSTEDILQTLQQPPLSRTDILAVTKGDFCFSASSSIRFHGIASRT